MRIMATSDLHGNLEGLDPRGADVVVLAGDVAPLKGRGPWHINDQKKWINKRFREWTSSYPGIQFVVIPGNHDFYPIGHILYKDQGIDWKYEFSPNVHFLGDAGTEIGGVRFYGTPWVPIISYSWAFEGESDTLKRWFAKIPPGLDVLVTHSPPRIPRSRIDMVEGRRDHCGSAELAEAVLRARPRHLFCGHIHTGSHAPVRLGSTLCRNVSYLDEQYAPAFLPATLEV